MSVNTREIVLGILLDIEKNNVFSNSAISKSLRNNQFIDKTQRAFISRMAEGTIEYKLQLDYIINCFSKTPVNKCKPLIRCVLRMSLYQVLYMDKVPDMAVCNEAVKLVKKHGMQNLTGFVNGVLRNICRNISDIKLPEDSDKKTDKIKYLSIKYSMPEWLCGFLIDNFNENAQKIIQASVNSKKTNSTTIRVNKTLITKEELKELLKEASITFEDGKYDDNAIIISNYDFIRKVPGFRQGFFSVQDESSMTAVREAGVKQGDLVLDLCAAPGGKTCYVAEILKGTGKVISRDLTEEKTQLIIENIQRLKYNNVEVQQADATILDNEMIGKADVVIADLPCSGLGIIGKKNDIKYRMTLKQMDELVILQSTILDYAKNYVKEDGTLVYSTCTINPKENQGNVEKFLANNKAFKKIHERTFIQGIDDCDGFYICVLKKENEEYK